MVIAMRAISLLVALALGAVILAGCSEKPQQPAGWKEPGDRTDNWQQQLRERGQAQNESNRINY